MGYRRILNFINIIEAICLPGEGNKPSLADVQFHVVNGTQPCICSISACSKAQSSAELTAWKILISSANNKYLEYLITLQMSLTNILKRREPSTNPCGTPEETAKGDEKAPKILTEEYLSVR
jgi:hypothetical protein